MIEMYYVEYRTKSNRIIGERKSLRTDNIARARGIVAVEIGTDDSLIGKIFTSKTGSKSVGYLYYSTTPIFIPIWVSDGKRYNVIDSMGRIHRIN